MKIKVTIAALLAAISALSFSVLSTTSTYNTVQSCTQLLPAGHRFNIQIEASVDTKGDEPTFSGSLQMNDGSMMPNPLLGKEVEPFKQCVIKLVK